MNNKFLYFLSITLLFISCHSEEASKSSYNEIKTTSNQESQKNNPQPKCVRSEGGYETTSYCIMILNTENIQQMPQKIKMLIKNKKTKDTQHITGEEWLDNDYNMYGFKGKNKDRVYEIDWREEKTHFRIWDASHKKLLEDELVIVGPEDILKDILKDKSTNP